MHYYEPMRLTPHLDMRTRPGRGWASSLGKFARNYAATNLPRVKTVLKKLIDRGGEKAVDIILNQLKPRVEHASDNAVDWLVNKIQGDHQSGHGLYLAGTPSRGLSLAGRGYKRSPRRRRKKGSGSSRSRSRSRSMSSRSRSRSRSGSGRKRKSSKSKKGGKGLDKDLLKLLKKRPFLN